MKSIKISNAAYQMNMYAKRSRARMRALGILKSGSSKKIIQNKSLQKVSKSVPRAINKQISNTTVKKPNDIINANIRSIVPEVINKHDIPHIPIDIKYIKTDGHSPLNKIYDQIYLINLERRPDRLALMKYRLDDLGIKYVKVNAVDGMKYQNMFNTLRNNQLKNLGELGIILSFIGILRDAQKNGYKKILCFEDDANFINNFNEELVNKQYLLNYQKYPVIYLGAFQPRWTDTNKKLISNKGYYEIDNFTYGCFGISFTNIIYEPLIRAINKYKLPIDNVFLKLAKDMNFRGLVIYPNLLIQDRTTSDIQARIKTNAGIHNLDEYTRLKWDITKYNFMPVFNFNKLANDLRKINMDMMTDDINKSNLLELLISKGINKTLFKEFIEFLFKKTKTINKNNLQKLIKY
jgi:GR25 family glycosyltransferase involved in LPS biosynthesis